MNKEPMEDMVDVFKCFICINTIEDARLCPSCSKLCCYQCIRRWLTEEKEDCPCCRWAGQVTKQIDKMQHLLKTQSSSSLNITENECASHKSELNVYCLTCQECICHHCAIWSTKHKTHSLKPLSEIYNQHSEKHLKNNKVLHRRLVELLSLLKDLENNIVTIQGSKEENISEIQKCAENMIIRINSSVSDKMKEIDQRRLRLNEEIMNVRIAREEIQKFMNRGKSDLIRNSERLQANFETFQSKSVSSFVTKPVSLDYTSELVPLFDLTTFTITNFSHLRHQADPIYSQVLHSSGSSWKLKVYPDGNAAVRGEYLSVFLELSSSLVEASAYDYRIEMVHQNDQDNGSIIREFSSVFAIGESWGYIRFFKLDSLVQEGFLDPITDALVLKFQVRPQTYFQKCKALQYQVDHLKEEQLQHKQQIKYLSTRKAYVEKFLLLEQGGDVASTSKLREEDDTSLVLSDITDFDLDVDLAILSDVFSSNGVENGVSNSNDEKQPPPSVENKDEVSISRTRSSRTDENEVAATEEDGNNVSIWLSENDIDFETMLSDNTVEDLAETSSTVSSVSSNALMFREQPITKSPASSSYLPHLMCRLPHRVPSSEGPKDSSQPSSSQTMPPKKVSAVVRPALCKSSDIYQSLTSSTHSIFSQSFDENSRKCLRSSFHRSILKSFHKMNGSQKSVGQTSQPSSFGRVLASNSSQDSSDDEHHACECKSSFFKKPAKLGGIKSNRKFLKKPAKKVSSSRSIFCDTSPEMVEGVDLFDVNYPSVSEVQGLSLSELPVHVEDDLSESSNETTFQPPPAKVTTEQVVVQDFMLDSSAELMPSDFLQSKIDSHHSSEDSVSEINSSDSDEPDEEHEDILEENQTNNE